ncbi:MAG TPA: cysteine desulfurase [Verrucomicrobiales bacterium]|nr:cysteine desulfurase [Verrucomicrobiales bacterium]HIL70977.1 cysteine desulfurase [Verrucomicrobiota bacterium]
MVYFDYNATTPVLPEVRQAWMESLDQYPGNPSSRHRVGKRADRAIENSRGQLADILGCDPLDLIWTSGATESSNIVLNHFHKTLQADEELWVSAVEHPCVLASVHHYFPERHRLLSVKESGELDLKAFSALLCQRRPGAVVIMAANNETGVLQPWRDVMDLCREHGVPFFCDAAQWIGKLPSADLGKVDFVCGCAHKFGGPKGVGFLKCAGNDSLRPLFHGGEQLEGRRPGTENVPGILAMLRALEIRESQLAQEGTLERSRRSDRFISEIAGRIPECRLLGESAPRLWNTVTMMMPAVDCRVRWVVKLDKAGFAVSPGSACASGNEEPSHVGLAMGLAQEETGRVLRFSGGWETAAEDWNKLLEALVDIYRSLTPSG